LWTETANPPRRKCTAQWINSLHAAPQGQPWTLAGTVHNIR
jgi:hypothetical protein